MSKTLLKMLKTLIKNKKIKFQTIFVKNKIKDHSKLQMKKQVNQSWVMILEKELYSKTTKR